MTVIETAVFLAASFSSAKKVRFQDDEDRAILSGKGQSFCSGANQKGLINASQIVLNHNVRDSQLTG